MSIVVVTVTTFERVDYLRCLWDQILMQTLQPEVWIIVDASRENNDQDRLSEVISREFRGKVGIRYRHTKNIPSEMRVIGRMREVGRLESLKAGYIVCMDDDDWNFPTRIEHSMKMLKRTGCEIAGCTRSFIADFDMGNMFQFAGYGSTHSANCAFSYTGHYAMTHKYDIQASHAEEASFTNGFSENMAQLDPFKCIVQLSHFTNTYSKKRLLHIMLSGHAQLGREVSQRPLSVIPKCKYKELIEHTHARKGTFEADIVYYCGMLSIEWDPRDLKLGGSEQAVVHLSCIFAEKMRVVVFGNFPFNELSWRNVTWKNASQFSCLYEYPVLILWRGFGMAVLDCNNLSANLIIVDLHDNSKYNYDMVDKHCQKIDYVMVKSRFHDYLVKRICPVAKCHVIPNGIRINEFLIPAARRPKHLVYASCYTRGLRPMLEITWPLLKKREPDVVLHVAYGMDNVTDEDFRNKMEHLLKQDGIIHHGRIPVQDVAYLKATCGYHLYYTNSDAEIDCISIRESLVAGCTPILSDHNLFNERAGVHLSLGFTEESYKKLAECIIILINRPLVDPDILRQSSTVLSWDDVAQRWLETLGKK